MTASQPYFARNYHLSVAIRQGPYMTPPLSERWLTSLRGEVFSDRNGYRTGVAQCWKELTVTLGYTGIKNLILRAETRRDFSNVSSFVASNGVGVRNNQQSYALEGVYQF